MSSLSNVNQKLGVQNLLKSMKNGQAQKTGLSSKVPAHMTENGSVFAANNSTVSVNTPTPATGGKAPTSKSQMDESIFQAGAANRGGASTAVYSTSQLANSSNVGTVSSTQNSSATNTTSKFSLFEKQIFFKSGDIRGLLSELNSIIFLNSLFKSNIIDCSIPLFKPNIFVHKRGLLDSFQYISVSNTEPPKFDNE